MSSSSATLIKATAATAIGNIQREESQDGDPSVKRRRVSDTSVAGSASVAAKKAKKTKNTTKEEQRRQSWGRLLQAAYQEETSVLDQLWDEESFAHLPSAEAFFQNVLAPAAAVGEQQHLVVQTVLPRTVSLTDLSSTCCNNKEQEDAIREDSTYGWFMDLEEADDDDMLSEDCYKAVNPYDGHDVVSDLAFSAATAPKRSDYEAELEWAQAADTVDDVLGDLF